ncbi:lipoprotein LpqH [Mycobacterium spongiae]|uniref:Lipoprotein LppE n=1 Tax=Mycobacterium spongiae TaxID=886343 RepID=A0A975JYB1_9MYCO|nr:lipoprotein LpqH [Mycobacterium spongiae]QUR67638.1 hypothetical protein F6B93_11480 [Mycobacterium spongiae]
MSNRLIAVAGFAIVIGVALAGCSTAKSVPRKAAQLTIDGDPQTMPPPACSQEQSYRTIDIRDRDGHVQAVVLITGERAIPQWVKIRNVDGFTGSYWSGGVGEATVERSGRKYTISGSAYGINSSNPNKVVTTNFAIMAEC